MGNNPSSGTPTKGDNPSSEGFFSHNTRNMLLLSSSVTILLGGTVNGQIPLLSLNQAPYMAQINTLPTPWPVQVAILVWAIVISIFGSTSQNQEEGGGGLWSLLGKVVGWYSVIRAIGAVGYCIWEVASGNWLSSTWSESGAYACVSGFGASLVLDTVNDGVLKIPVLFLFSIYAQFLFAGRITQSIVALLPPNPKSSPFECQGICDDPNWGPIIIACGYRCINHIAYGGNNSTEGLFGFVTSALVLFLVSVVIVSCLITHLFNPTNFPVPPLSRGWNIFLAVYGLIQLLIYVLVYCLTYSDGNTCNNATGGCQQLQSSPICGQLPGGPDLLGNLRQWFDEDKARVIKAVAFLM